MPSSLRASSLRLALSRIYSYCLKSFIRPSTVFPLADKMAPNISSIDAISTKKELNIIPVLNLKETQLNAEPVEKAVEARPDIKSTPVRPAPPRPRPVQKQPTAEVTEDTIFFRQEMMNLAVFDDEGNVTRYRKIDLKITERKVNRIFRHHEYIAVDCHTGEVFKQTLSARSYDFLVNKREARAAKNMAEYRKTMKDVNKMAFSATQINERLITISAHFGRTEPRIQLARLEGAKFTKYMLTELEKEENEHQHVRAACERQRWNELAQDIVAASRKKEKTIEEHGAKDSYMTLVRRELANMRAA